MWTFLIPDSGWFRMCVWYFGALLFWSILVLVKFMIQDPWHYHLGIDRSALTLIELLRSILELWSWPCRKGRKHQRKAKPPVSWLQYPAADPGLSWSSDLQLRSPLKPNWHWVQSCRKKAQLAKKWAVKYSTVGNGWFSRARSYCCKMLLASTRIVTLKTWQTAYVVCTVYKCI